MKKILVLTLLLTVFLGTASAYKFLGPKWPGGSPLVGYHINERGCEDVADESPYLHRSFEVWQVSTTAIKCEYKGTTNVNASAYDKVNTLRWAEGSDWEFGGNVIAVCYTWYQYSDIVDFDIVFNGQNFAWSTTGEQNKMDVAHIATHEIGHGLGLGHSTVREAVMWPTASAGDTAHRHLEADDSMGISVLYPRTYGNNRPPVITSKPVTEAIAGEKYEYQVSAEDPDGDSVKYSLSTFPLNMRIDSLTGKIVWYPKFLDLGARDVIVLAKDKMGGTGRQAFKINVTDLVVYTDDDTAAMGDTFYLDVKVTSMDEYGIVAGNIAFAYNDSQMTALGVDTTGSVVAGATFARNTTPDSVRIAFAGPQHFRGKGTLFRIKLLIKEEYCGVVLQPKIARAFFNDGNPVAVTKSGTLYPQCSPEDPRYGKSIEGTVTHGGNAGGVGSATITLVELGRQVETSENGSFIFGQVPRSSTAYTVAVKKDSGDVREAVSAYDASLLLRHVVGLENLSDSAIQKKCADVNGNDLLTAYDAALILRYVVGIDEVTDIGTWVLQPEKTVLPQLLQNATNVNFKAYMIGDVSNNWNKAGSGMPKRTAGSAPSVALSQFSTGRVTTEAGPVPAYTTTLSFRGGSDRVFSGEFVVNYDSRNYRLLAVKPLALLNGSISASNAIGDRIRIAFAGTEPLAGSGDLFEVSLVPLDAAAPPAGMPGEVAFAYERLNESTDIIVGRQGQGLTSRSEGISRIRGVYPNPFDRLVTVELSVAGTQNVSVVVYDLFGRVVARLAQRVMTAGTHRLTWDIASGRAKDLGAKVYLLEFRSGDRTSAQRVRLYKAR